MTQTTVTATVTTMTAHQLEIRGYALRKAAHFAYAESSRVRKRCVPGTDSFTHDMLVADEYHEAGVQIDALADAAFFQSDEID